mmetsp:Transcript_16388/g.27407  ORF Transcript_16388/g.27407 Transcript_16388/m.27407 type:complete len:405 (-) Transcript_16388:619-1833(-)
MGLMESIHDNMLPVIVSSAVTCVVSYIYLTAVRCPVAQLPVQRVQELATQAGASKDLLLGKVAIVTGSTSGLGQEIAAQLYKLNCTVVIASRSPTKCAATVEQIRAAAPSSRGSLQVLALDTCDLNKVAAFVQQFQREHSKLNFLVNNAGMLYLTNMEKASPESPLRSPQGYDQLFATNFMGHFLLTELLLPLLKATPGGRIVNVASSVHLQVFGDALRPPASGEGLPTAARSDIYTTRHWADSYGNSKLAQMLHMAELQALLDSDTSTDLKVVSVCPGFVNTAMVPDRPISRFISRFFFSSEAATLAPLAALLDPTLQGGEWLTNFAMMWTGSLLPYLVFRLCSLVGLRDFFMGIIASPEVILFQNYSYGVHQSHSSPEAQDRNLSGQFYNWCLEETAKYRNE